MGTKGPVNHSLIELGRRVLAEDEAEGGHYATEVIATKAGDVFVLRRSGFELPDFARPRRALALLHPEAVEAME